MSTYIVGYAGNIYTVGATRRKSKTDPVMSTIRYANRWARYFNVPISWIVTLAHLESSHNPKKVNMAAAQKGGAWGLMQQMADEAPYKIAAIRRTFRAHKPIMDLIRKKWRGRPQDLLDPDLSVILASWQLGRLRKEFGDDFATVAAAYHQGAGAVRKRIEEGRPPVNPRQQPKGYQYVQRALTTEESYEPVLAVYTPNEIVEGEHGIENYSHI